MTSKLISQGAEAKILLSEDIIIKNRISKPYRIKELDNKIRKLRTKAETKLLQKASKVINAPVPEISERYKINMPYIKGKKLSEYLDKFPITKQKAICRQIGKDVAKLHDADIIHGDLTTSNMILVEDIYIKNKLIKKKNSDKLANKNSEDNIRLTKRVVVGAGGWTIYFLDFGLGFISKKFEDKAVDIHLFKQALEAKHFQNWEVLFNEFVKGYKKSKNSKIVFERLKAVEKRGRYRH